MNAFLHQNRRKNSPLLLAETVEAFSLTSKEATAEAEDNT
jgi:hypothetical protein